MSSAADSGGRKEYKDGPILISPGGTMTNTADASKCIEEAIGAISAIDSKLPVLTALSLEEPAESSRGSSPLKSPQSLVSPALSEVTRKGCDVRELFGGAITAILPPSYLDASDIRQVPDNQECFMSPHSNSTIIVEVVEYQESQKDERAALYFFEDLCECIEVSRAEVSSYGCIDDPSFMSEIRETFPKCVLMGEQYLPIKDRPPAVEKVYVMLAVVRLKIVNSELLIYLSSDTRSMPADISSFLLDLSAELEANASVFSLGESSTATVGGGCTNTSTMSEEHKEGVMLSPTTLALPPSDVVFRTFVNSLKVVDWSLFV